MESTKEVVKRAINFNLRHLRAFQEIAACQSISHAAARIHLTQPAITQALAKLETLHHCLPDCASGWRVDEFFVRRREAEEIPHRFAASNARRAAGAVDVL